MLQQVVLDGFLVNLSIDKATLDIAMAEHQHALQAGPTGIGLEVAETQLAWVVRFSWRRASSLVTVLRQGEQTIYLRESRRSQAGQRLCLQLVLIDPQG